MIEWLNFSENIYATLYKNGAKIKLEEVNQGET